MRVLSRVKLAFLNSKLLLNVEDRIDRALVRLWSHVPTGERHENRHLLLSGPGDGSVGDQAMLEAFVANISGRVTIITRSRSSIGALPPSRSLQVDYLILPQLLYGSFATHIFDFMRLRSAIASSRSFSVVGADVMDGVYTNRASARRFRLAELAGKLGLDSRVLGFSWNSHPSHEARGAMTQASKESKLIARDPVSAERLVRDGAERVEVSADLAFLVEPSGKLSPELEGWLASQRQLNRNVVILNVNRLLERYVDQVSIFSAAVSQGIEAGTSFIFLPHDSRGAPSDATLLAAIAEEVARPDFTFRFDSVLPPGDVAELASRSDFVVTGRMHLAILSMISGTPPISISYQGKIEGLYRSLGISCFLEPDADLAENLTREFVAMSTNHTQVRSIIKARIPALRSLALGNVAGLIDTVHGESRHAPVPQEQELSLSGSHSRGSI
ncbi:polysaccharide pyruvyl transferase family protein [soil metagenome]